MNIVSKITTTYTTVTSTNNNNADKDSKDSPNNDSSTSLASVTSSTTQSVVIPPSLATKAMTASTLSSQLQPGRPDELALKYQGLECLVSILRSLVAWCSNKSSIENGEDEKEEPVRDSEETMEFISSQTTFTNKSSSPSSSTMSVSGSIYNDVKTTKAIDDPEEFENLKHRKQILQDGIKKFNFKPKKVSQCLLCYYTYYNLILM